MMCTKKTRADSRSVTGLLAAGRTTRGNPAAAELKFCSAVGATPEEAVRVVRIAKRAWLKVAKEQHRPIPKPTYRPAIYQLAR